MSRQVAYSMMHSVRSMQLQCLCFLVSVLVTTTKFELCGLQDVHAEMQALVTVLSLLALSSSESSMCSSAIEATTAQQRSAILWYTSVATIGKNTA
jgi:hypothetical protein